MKLHLLALHRNTDPLEKTFKIINFNNKKHPSIFSLAHTVQWFPNKRYFQAEESWLATHSFLLFAVKQEEKQRKKQKEIKLTCMRVEVNIGFFLIKVQKFCYT